MPEPSSPANAAVPWLVLAPDAAFAISQTIDVAPRDAEPFHRDVSLDVDVLGRTSDVLNARAVFVRHGDPVPLAGLELTLSEAAEILDVRLVCGGASQHDLDVTLPHLLRFLHGARPVVLRTDFTAAPVSVDERTAGSLRASVSLEDVQFFSLRLSGAADLRVVVVHDEDDLPTADVDIDFDGIVTAYRQPARRSTLHVDERIEVRRLATPVDLLSACGRAPLSTDAVEAGLRTVSRRILACTMREQEESPNFTGDYVIELTVMPDGTFADVEVVATPPVSDTLSQCIVAAVSSVRLSHGSSAGPAGFSFPHTAGR